jgi:HAD superfamily hydrolase (TIGR01549 family)
VSDTAVFDLDGTLVDSNYQQALAWYRALRRYGVTAAVWRIHRSVGMGGDKLITAVAGEQAEAEHGDDIRAAKDEEMEPLYREVAPFEGARDLLAEVRKRGFTVVLASSGGSEQTEYYVDLIGARDIAASWTTASDFEETKPAPDLVQAAMTKVGGRSGVMVGDSPYDARAASALGMTTLAVRTGGFSVDELVEAGARTAYESLTDLCADLDDTPLARGE